MDSNQDYDRLLNEAKAMYAAGHDNVYIELQFAEQGIDDRTIDKIITDINEIRKKIKKSQGVQQIVLCMSCIGMALVVAFITSHSQSPIIILLCGSAITGVFILIKGVLNLLNF